MHGGGLSAYEVDPFVMKRAIIVAAILATAVFAYGVALSAGGQRRCVRRRGS